MNLGAPGITKFSYTQEDFETGSGTIRNSGQIVFNTALLDWDGFCIAICDSPYVSTDESQSPGNANARSA